MKGSTTKLDKLVQDWNLYGREWNSKLLLGSNILNDASHGILFTEPGSFRYLDFMASLDLLCSSSCLKISVWLQWQTCLNIAMVLGKIICQRSAYCLRQQKDFHTRVKIHLGQVAFDKLTVWFFTLACSKTSLSHDISDVLAKMWPCLQATQQQSAQLCFKTVLTKNSKRSKATFPTYSLHMMFNWQRFFRRLASWW